MTLAAATVVLALSLTTGCGEDATPGATQGQAGSTTGTTSVSPTSSTTTADADTSPIPTSPSGETMTTVTYAPPYTGTTQAGVPLPPLESNALARELKRTSQAGAKLAGDMQAEGAASDDPRSGTVFALRARAQAITARRAIVDGQLPLADEAVRQLGRLLAEAARTAAGDTATALAQAQGHMALMAFPSQATLQAASVLDQVIRDLGPLVPEESPPTS
jgi:hypothetical protein